MTPFSFASAISSGRKPALSVVLCAMGGIRTIEDRTPRFARPTTASSTTLRTRRVPLYASPPGRAGSSSVAGRPRSSHPGEPMLPDTTSGFPVPASASPHASRIWSPAAATASSPPEGSRSCLCATWMTPSDSAAAALSPSRSEISPRRTLAPSAETAAADASDLAKPVTSWPAAMRSGTMHEPIWPVPPVTKTFMLLLLVGDVWGVLRLGSVEKADADREVGVLDGVGEEAQRQQADVLQRSRHRQGPGIHWTQSEALDERRDACLRLRVIPGDEHVQWVPLGGTGSQNVGELGVERLDDIRVGRGGLGDLLCAGTVPRGHKARG